MLKFIASLLFGAVLVGCNSANSRVSPIAFGATKGIVTSGNLRLVTERQRYGYPPVVCTEPSPDYMVAFGSASKLTGSAPSAAGARSADLSITTTEEVSEGKGREAGVLALRDGLYTACQNYANGVIGQDAYAIILSQYGNLLVALVGNDNASANVQVSGPQAALSAITVACISGYDKTRASVGSNALLTPQFCRDVLAKVVTRSVSDGSTQTTGRRAERGNGAGKKPDSAVAASGSTVTTPSPTAAVVK
jgi:hypothetical protein